jgi:hypothetical protein
VAAVERGVSVGIDRASAFGRWLQADRSAVDGLLQGALARGGDRDAVRSAVVELAAVPWAPPGADLDPALGRALVARVADLAARGRWTTGDPDRTVVLEVLPRLAGLLGGQPAATVEAVGGAARTVARSGDLALLGSLLAGVPGAADARAVRSAVLVATWRAGAARYRSAALREAAVLDVPAAAAALGLPAGANVADTLTRHGRDPWWWPGIATSPGVLRRVGGFRGYGGPWLGLPRVVRGGPTGCAVSADGARWAVVADIHGAAVARLDEEPGEVPTPSPLRLPVPWTDQVTGSAPVGRGSSVLVVSRAHSYRLDVVRVAA